MFCKSFYIWNRKRNTLGVDMETKLNDFKIREGRSNNKMKLSSYHRIFVDVSKCNKHENVVDGIFRIFDT